MLGQEGLIPFSNIWICRGLQIAWNRILTNEAKFIYSKNELGYKEVHNNMASTKEITIITDITGKLDWKVKLKF